MEFWCTASAWEAPRFRDTNRWKSCTFRDRDTAISCLNMRVQPVAKFLASIPKMPLKAPISVPLATPATSTRWATPHRLLPAVPTGRLKSELNVRVVRAQICVPACWCMPRQGTIHCRGAGEIDFDILESPGNQG